MHPQNNLDAETLLHSIQQYQRLHVKKESFLDFEPNLYTFWGPLNILFLYFYDELQLHLHVFLETLRLQLRLVRHKYYEIYLTKKSLLPMLQSIVLLYLILFDIANGLRMGDEGLANGKSSTFTLTND